MTIVPGQMIPEYETKYFTQFYDNPEDFTEECKNSGLLGNSNSGYLLKDESLNILFYLLYARYGNSPIANLDENQFRYKMFSIIFQYGPTWEKRLEIQAELRGYTIAQASQGAKSIYNHAFNPETQVTTEEIDFINDQNVSKYTKAPIDAAMGLWDMLRVDVSEVFLKQFQKLFLKVVVPQNTYIYTTNLEVEDE